MPSPPLLPGARTILFNALAQNHVDMGGFQLWNLDTSNLTIGGPNGQPAVPHNWINSYNAGTRLFTVTQPATADLSDWPPLVNGQFLTNNGSVVSWGAVPGTQHGFVNVKDPPYNAVGDGVTDDSGAIQNAINAASGRTVYIPYGTYYIGTKLTLQITGTLLGDGMLTSVLKGNPASGGGILQIQSSGCIVRGLGFNGVSPNLTQPASFDAPIALVNVADCVISECFIQLAALHGISLTGCQHISILDSVIDNCGYSAIQVFASPRTRISRCKVRNTIDSGIVLSNSPNSFVNLNQITNCGVMLAGIHAKDSDFTTINGNNISRCAFGILADITPGRGQQAYGITVTGNNIFRNYEGGIRFGMAHGFVCSGNTLTDNGQGGNDNTILTMEPGITVVPGSGGTGYQVGDVLSISGGTGTAAKVAVRKVGAGGALLFDSLAVVNMGTYTVFPANPCSATGGTGTGAQFTYVNSFFDLPGSGYVSGQVLRSINGSFLSPVRIVITKVGTGGAVQGYDILDGGGYLAVPPPDGGLFFTPDCVADGVTGGGGFHIIPSWGKRYSANFNAFKQFGVCVYGPVFGGLIGNNAINTTRQGTGILIQDDVAPFNGRPSYLCVTENSNMNNQQSLAGNTVGGALDGNLGSSSIFANNIIFPPGT